MPTGSKSWGFSPKNLIQSKGWRDSWRSRVRRFPITFASFRKAGLVAARAEGYYSVYSLNTDRLQELARDLLSEETLPRFAGDVDVGAYDRKVLGTFLDEEGRVMSFPSQQKKYKVLLRHVLEAFEPGTEYSEAQVNEILLGFNDDTARLRRSLVDFGYMAREGGGGAYWRVA